ncbi:unnamed protein product [Parnassius apollo]|uniref:(apollo) hypothetical protein n=1 Tax=Parnassius apollo TaxID=110799 RepID=A0A8S3XYR9_PARAO|nr:unnamed protein product [Parnassius apollo]
MVGGSKICTIKEKLRLSRRYQENTLQSDVWKWKSSYLLHEVTNHLTTEEGLPEVIDNFKENDLNDEQQTSEHYTSENTCTLCEEHGILIDDMTCPLCSKEADIEHNRSEAKLNLEYQAIKMKQNSAAKFPECHIGDTVRVKIPEVDRGRGDFRNILLTVLDKNEDRLYKLGNENGTIEQFFFTKSVYNS